MAERKIKLRMVTEITVPLKATNLKTLHLTKRESKKHIFFLNIKFIILPVIMKVVRVRILRKLNLSLIL